MSNLRDEMKADAEQYGAGSGNNFFRFDKSGVYKLRILTKPKALATHFFGKGIKPSICYGQAEGCPFHTNPDEKPSVKYQTYVIDRSDGDKIKMGEIPWSVLSAVADFQEDEDYAFSDYPMPYDIKVTVDKDASPADIYKTIASPNRIEITALQATELHGMFTKKSPEVYVEQRKDKQLEEHKQNGIWQEEQKRREKVQEGIEEAKAKGGESVMPDDYADARNAEVPEIDF